MKIKYHFFGRDCIIDRALLKRENLEDKLVCNDFKCDKILLLNQIHGKEVVIVDRESKIYGVSGLPKADAIVTNLKNIAIGVVTADCAPILFYDEENAIIAAAHAGWRGAKCGVVNSTIVAMKNLGAKNIAVIIGPMIQQNSYQVSEEFYQDFLNEESSNRGFFIKDGANAYKFDLPAYIEEKIAAEGVKNITNLRIDTYKNEEKFFSFRRSTHCGESDCGRNVSVIALTK